MVSQQVQFPSVVSRPLLQTFSSPAPLADRFSPASTPVTAGPPPSPALAVVSPGQISAPPRLDDSITVNGVTVTLEQAARVAPILLLHPAETYLPCSAEYLLEDAVLVTEDGAQIQHPTPADLQAHRGSQARLLVDPAHFGGEPLQGQAVQAPMYVSVQVAPDGQTIDLNYLFLYAFNGAQTVRVRVPRADYNCVLPHIAEHGGDLECITVRVSADFQTIHFVRTEAHGHNAFFTRPGEEVEFENGHPLVYCAYNNHANFNVRGNPSEGWVTDTHASALGFGVDFINMVSRSGPRWQPFAENASGQAVPNGQLRFVGVQNGAPVTDQTWAAYAGRIGEHHRNVFVGATAVGGGPLPGVRRRLADMLTRAILSTGAVTHRLETDGIPALGDRPVAQAGTSFWDPNA